MGGGNRDEERRKEGGEVARRARGAGAVYPGLLEPGKWRYQWGRYCNDRCRLALGASARKNRRASPRGRGRTMSMSGALLTTHFLTQLRMGTPGGAEEGLLL